MERVDTAHHNNHRADNHPDVRDITEYEEAKPVAQRDWCSENGAMKLTSPGRMAV